MILYAKHLLSFTVKNRDIDVETPLVWADILFLGPYFLPGKKEGKISKAGSTPTLFNSFISKHYVGHLYGSQNIYIVTVLNILTSLMRAGEDTTNITNI